ncbi:hypothetical protein VTN77DRAFT_2979 [Rasamsonia byssochlamydoides]|uniref:uncharacterized protein n=1 Tax=Rasamsonia byssochlamydoides TaxID=89139 RepID=UPI00374210B7
MGKLAIDVHPLVVLKFTTCSRLAPPAEDLQYATGLIIFLDLVTYDCNQHCRSNSAASSAQYEIGILCIL